MATFAFDTPCLGRVRRPNAHHRLFCLPFPGAAASAFLPWADVLPLDVELWAVQLPGREDRFVEPPQTCFETLVDELADAIAPHTADTPFALFGHSGGALLAFELARALRERGQPAPTRLFLSAEPPPDVPRSATKLHTLDDAELVQRLRTRGGTPPEIAENEELMELLLPVLRADFTWYETYEYRPGPQLESPVTAFVGHDDPIVGAEAVSGWRSHTTGSFEARGVTGGHFFVQDAMEEIVSHVVRALRPPS
ncbi:alpha/beta fold hydrolase [Streptomyces sp. FXJ1.4098]|uniref:thioesterase II family protein n=1 Tax=Streptomyces sp. NPDC020845 TaxID=3365096 RepID=UPI00299A3562|nr:alpha/beta fold hydrolase [Streptomyces sp. FXJ1.4098]